MKLNIVAAAALALALLPPPLFAQTPKEWTVLVYLAADNDLEEAAVDDLKEMLEAGSSPGLNLVVQVDRAEGYSDEPVANLKNWTSAKRLYVQKGSFRELADLGETNTADPKTLGDFVAWGLKSFPAKKTAVILWDHGGGQAGFGVDEGSEGAMLSLPQVRDGLAGGVKAAGAPRIDLLGFDACLMSTLETARLLAPLARYLLASEETEPGFGWDWTTFSLLNRSPSTEPPALASALLASYAAYCRANGEGAQYTLALTDLSREPAVETALKALRGAALPKLKAVGGEFGRARFTSVEFGKSGDPASDTHLVDLGDLARQWQKVPALQPAAQALGEAVRAMVLDQTRGSVQTAATGLSIWFPPERQYYDPDYAAFGPPDWVSLLTGYYQAGAALPPEERADAAAEPEAADTGVEWDGETLTFTRSFDRKVIRNIADALLYYGTVDGKNRAQVLGSRSADLDRKTGAVTGVWDLTALSLVQGRTKVPVFLAEDQAEENQMSFSVPFSYYPDGNVKAARSKEDVWLSVTIDLQTDEIVEETFFQDTEGDLVGEFQPDPGSRIVARLLERNPKGEWDYVDRGPALDPTKPVDYEYRVLDPAASFYLSLDVTDYGGTEASQEYEGPLP